MVVVEGNVHPKSFDLTFFIIFTKAMNPAGAGGGGG